MSKGKLMGLFCFTCVELVVWILNQHQMNSLLFKNHKSFKNANHISVCLNLTQVEKDIRADKFHLHLPQRSE